MEKVPRERMYVVFILIFFSLLFWSFFEQSGSSVNNFTDRNIDRVIEATSVTDQDVGKTIAVRLNPDAQEDNLKSLQLLSQEFLGQVNGSSAMREHISRAVEAVEGVKEERTLSDEDLKNLLEQPKLTMTALTYLAPTPSSRAPTRPTTNWIGPLPRGASIRWDWAEPRFPRRCTSR